MPRDVYKDLLGTVDLIVTPTGNVAVCDKKVRKALKPSVVFSNIGHFDDQISTPSRAKLEVEQVKPQVHRMCAAIVWMFVPEKPEKSTVYAGNLWLIRK